MPTRRTFDKAEFLPNDNSKPHIVPDVLYPAIGGKLLDGTTSHSGNYGTSQTDSRKYYYTDIKGSKPIRDPRIGAYFGSQRHKFKSLQLLEQETATHGGNVYSVDGREWIRFTGSYVFQNNDQGNVFYLDDDGFIEITGYFSEANLISLTYSSGRDYKFSIDGGSSTTKTTFNTSANTPLASRYVDAGSVANIGISQTLGIHTLKLEVVDGEDTYMYGVELIAQDTTNAVTRNKIQIPSQTVFSFGSKFTVGGSSAATHYDPFSAKSDGTGWTSPTSGTNTPNSSAAWPSNIDTATSLGLAKWVDGTNYYRPYNGGRVVKWVDENGEIKTSVTVMPPNAKSIADSGTLSNATAKSNGSAPNDNFRPTFEAHTSSVDEDLLSEVAKTFHFREFGNGAANGGTGATWADASMLSGTADDIAYVMDDGLTSMSGHGVKIQNLSINGGVRIDSNSKSIYFTFIGTGIKTIRQRDNSTTEEPVTWAQNLPYGTHILELQRNGSAYQVVNIDGITLETNSTTDLYLIHGSPTFFQPKMPPIPEGACMIADYMLMADFVAQTSAGTNLISKGVRRNSSSRDFFYNETDGDSFSLAIDVSTSAGLKIGTSGTADSDTSFKMRLPSFGINYVSRGYQQDTRLKLFIDDTDKDSASTKDNTADYGSYSHLTNNVTLGINNFGANVASGQVANLDGFDIVTPIHTSHHYTLFETPYLKELIGGDRNMEQTHLICSADGKTWDEVTRDTSYIGNALVKTHHNNEYGNVVNIFDEWRGGAVGTYGGELFNKDFAIAYDRMICLKEGNYMITFMMRSNKNDDISAIYVNGTMIKMHKSQIGLNSQQTTVTINLKRGDYVQGYGVSGQSGVAQYQILINFQIIRL